MVDIESKTFAELNEVVNRKGVHPEDVHAFSIRFLCEQIDQLKAERAAAERIVDSIAVECRSIAQSKGWREDNDGELIALTHCELSELCETLRREPRPSDHIPEFTASEEEAADVVIRILNLSASRGWRIGEAIGAKMAFNRTRLIRHGGKRF